MNKTHRSRTLHATLAGEGALTGLIALGSAPLPAVLVGSVVPAAIGWGWGALLDAKTRQGGPARTVQSAARWSCLLVFLSYGAWARLVASSERPAMALSPAQEGLCAMALFLSIAGIPVLAGWLHRSARVGWLTITIPIPLSMAIGLGYSLLVAVGTTLVPSDIHGGMELVVVRFYMWAITLVLLVTLPFAALLVLKLAASAPASRAWPGPRDSHGGRWGRLLAVRQWAWPAAVARAWSARPTQWKPGLVLGAIALAGSLTCTLFGDKLAQGWLVAGPLFRGWLRILDLPGQSVWTVFATTAALLRSCAKFLLGASAALPLFVSAPLLHAVCNGCFWALTGFWIGGRLPDSRLRSCLRAGLLVLLLAPAITAWLWLLIDAIFAGPPETRP